MPFDVFALRDRVVDDYRDYVESFINILDCQSALNIDPLSASNIDPSCGREEVVPVVHRGDPRGFV